MPPRRGGFLSDALEQGAPGSGGERVGAIGWGVIRWALGWVLAAILAVSPEQRRHGGLLLAAAALAVAEGRGQPGRAQEWASALRGRTIEVLAEDLELGN